MVEETITINVLEKELPPPTEDGRTLRVVRFWVWRNEFAWIRGNILKTVLVNWVGELKSAVLHFEISPVTPQAWQLLLNDEVIIEQVAGVYAPTDRHVEDQIINGHNDVLFHPTIQILPVIGAWLTCYIEVTYYATDEEEADLDASREEWKKTQAEAGETYDWQKMLYSIVQFLPVFLILFVVLALIREVRPRRD